MASPLNQFYLDFLAKYDKMHSNLEFKCKTLSSLKDVNQFVECYQSGKKALGKEYKEYQAMMAYEDMQLEHCQAQEEECKQKDLQARQALLKEFTSKANRITYF